MDKKRFKTTSQIILAIIFIVLINNRVNSQTIRIMPLGNSITAGSMCTNGDIHTCVALGGNNAVGYRQKLSSLLTAAGYNFDFVGSEQYGYSIMSDADCAGFGGIRDSQLADIMETGSSSHYSGTVSNGPYMNSYPADIVLLHIGTNDFLASDTAWTDIPRILDAIDDYEVANNTTVTVFLARIISSRYAACWTNPWVMAYNRLIDNLAASRIANGDQLILVDMECGAGMDYNNDMMDQVHPNQAGYDKMGEAWFAAIEAWSTPTGPTYSLTMEPSIGSGTTFPSEGAHNYAQGSTVTLTATAAAGYIFTGWSGDQTGNDNPASILMDGNKNIAATFEQRNYSLTVITDSTAGAIVQPDGTISVGHGVQTAISVDSIPEGSSFDGWEIISGSSVSIANPFSQSTTVKLESGNATVRANFTNVTHSVRIDITGEGTVGKTPDLENYPKNSVVTLTALPAEGHHFVRWTGDVTGTANPADLLMNGEKGLRATFQKSTYQLTVSTDGTAGSAVNPAGTVTVDHGAQTSISVSQVPGGFVFDGWEVTAGSSVFIADPSSLSTFVKLESGDGTVQANFASASHSISIATVGEGSVAKMPDQAEYPHKSMLTLTATPENGYYFVGWTGDLVGENNPVDVLMDENKDIIASFEKIRYELTVITDGTAGAIVDPAGTSSVDPGIATDISVIQVPEGFIFNGWEVTSGTSVILADPSSLSTTVKLESGNGTIQANFVSNTHSLNLQVSGMGSIDKTPDQAEYAHNSVLTLAATPESGYYFVGWTGDLEGESNPVEVLMDGNKEITASFERLIYELTVTTDGTNGAEVDPEGTLSVDHGEETVIAVSQVPVNSKFNGWEIISGSSVTINDPSSISATVRLESGNATIRANFKDSVTAGTIQSLDNTGSLVILPNPAVDYIHIKLTNYAGLSGRIQVIDLNGQQLISRDIDIRYPHFQIEITDLAPGIYMLRWIMDSGEVKKGKFVKLN